MNDVVLGMGVLLGVLVTVGLVMLERRGLVELEWNPFSNASKAARAERRGLIGEALYYYDRAGQPDRLTACLRRNLAESPLRTALGETVGELLALKSAWTRIAASLPWASWTMDGRTWSYVQEVSEGLWWSAERIAAASPLWDPGEPLPDFIQAEIDRLQRLRESVRQIRTQLARAILADPDQRTLTAPWPSPAAVSEAPRESAAVEAQG